MLIVLKGVIIHMTKRRGRLRFVVRALVDFVGIMAPMPKYDVDIPKSGKRILVFNWRDHKHTYAGGAEVYIEELSKRWVKEGNHVTLFCGSDGRGAPRHEIEDGINVIRRGGQYFVFIWAFLYYMIRMRGKYDVIIDCHNGIPFFTPLFAREPVICVVHHIHQDVFKEHLPKLQAKFACWLEAVLMPRAYKYSQYVAVSPSTKKEMEELGMKSDKGIAIVYNGVDLDTLVPGKKSNSPLVLFLGRLQAYKSVDVLLNSFQKVLKKTPNAKLVIAGSGDASDSLKQLSKDLNIQDSVVFTGKISEEKKRGLFQKAWVMANPSMKEGWGITTVEANACATPVIGSDVPGLRDSIIHDETGSLVPYGDSKTLADRLTWILKDHKSRDGMSEKSCKWAQKFHWDDSARQLGDLITKEVNSLDHYMEKETKTAI